MKIALVGSLTFASSFKYISLELIKRGYEIEIPPTAQKIISGKLELKLVEEEKLKGTFSERSTQDDAIRRYWKIIQKTDAILVLNYDKNGIKNYIGGNAFLEMGFAHVLDKKIYLLNPIPEMSYTDEIKTMQPLILHHDFSKIV